MKPEMPIYLRPKDVAEYFGVSTITVFKWISRGLLTHFRVSNGHRGHARIRRTDLETFEREFTHPAARYLAGLGPRPEDMDNVD